MVSFVYAVHNLECQPVVLIGPYINASEAAPVFDALSEGGKVIMPLHKTFWAESFGMLTDRFGTPWIVNGGLIEPQTASH